MHSNDKDRLSQDQDSQGDQRGIFDFSAPLGSYKSGRLIIASEAKRLELKAGPVDEYLYQARTWHFAPHIGLNGNIVTLEYGNFTTLEQLVSLPRLLAEVRLNASIPWEIELYEEISHLNAELRRLRLRSLDILGHASQIKLALPRTPETSYLYISGGIHHSQIHIPPDAGVRVQISGGVTHLVFDDQHIGSLGEQLSLESSNFHRTSGRYDIYITGGSGDLTIDRWA